MPTIAVSDRCPGRWADEFESLGTAGVLEIAQISTVSIRPGFLMVGAEGFEPPTAGV